MRTANNQSQSNLGKCMCVHLKKRILKIPYCKEALLHIFFHLHP